MNQSERRKYLIDALLKESRMYQRIQLPADTDEQKQLLRSLMNLRPASPITEEFEDVQDEYLKDANAEKGFITLSDMDELQPDIFLWQGDNTRLKVDAIVNAANSGMTGCYQPCHNYIDNCIHTYAGIQLRNYCAELMEKQGHEEPTGKAKITPGFNLPCDFVIHTVGPIVHGRLTSHHEELLRSCYESCLKIADENNVESIAFCCISTGVFMFPNRRAAEIAVQTVKEYKQTTGSQIKVVFNVFKDSDREIYKELL